MRVVGAKDGPTVQVAAAVFGAARWASLDDLLLHAALGLHAAPVTALLHEEEWEEQLQVLCCVMVLTGKARCASLPAFRD